MYLTFTIHYILFTLLLILLTQKTTTLLKIGNRNLLLIFYNNINVKDNIDGIIYLFKIFNAKYNIIVEH